MSTVDDLSLLKSALAQAANLAPSIIAESTLFGILTLLVSFSSITVARQGITTKSRAFVVFATSVMYIASGIHWSVNVYTFMREIRDPVAWAALPIEDIYRWSVITAVALFYNFWFSDIIVMWRAVVVWEWDRRITIPCGILVVMPAVFATIDIGTSHVTPYHKAIEPNIYGTTALAVSLFANVFATSLIAIKAWIHRKEIRRYFGTSNTKAVHDVLILLVESGVLYCAVWAVSLICTLLNKGSFANVSHTLSGVVPPLVGLYPTIIIVLATLQKTHCDRKFTYGPETSDSVRFAASRLSAVFTTIQLEEGQLSATVISRRSDCSAN